MIIETIKLNEMSVFTEFFLGISIMYLLMHSLFVSFNNNLNFPIVQSSLINLSILVLLMSCLLLWNDNLIILKYTTFSNTIVNDYLSFFAKIVIGVSSSVCLLLIKDYLYVQKINSFEYIIILLFSILGLFLLCSANDFITIYLALELQSLAFYVLAAFKKDSAYSVESGLKYFILGAFSSGLFLFGSSLIYGVFGTVNLTDLKDLSFIILNETETNYLKINNFVVIGLLLIFISLFFKLALAPFHIWSPDIYENSPTSSTFFFAVVPKISIFVVIIRLSYYALYDGIFWWQEIVAVIALASVIVGAMGGLEQRKFKSLLAYSSISHMGYLLITFVSASFEGFQMLFSYLVIYIASGLCLWSIFMLTRLKKINNKKQNKDLADFILLRKSNKMLALIFATALFSIAGLPPLVGFIVKLNIFLIAIKKTFYFLAFLSISFSVISTFFYLRIVKILYFEPVLVGRLYHPIEQTKVVILILLFFLFIFMFLNPSILYLLSYKASFLFI